MTDTTAFDWRSFLLRWSGEWADSLPDGDAQGEDEAARRARWLGFPPASEERIAAMKERLGRRMPPSYRKFLKVSDGWRHAGGFVWLLAGTEDARWHNNESGLADMFPAVGRGGASAFLALLRRIPFPPRPGLRAGVSPEGV